jgi:hypothetical protein
VNDQVREEVREHGQVANMAVGQFEGNVDQDIGLLFGDLLYVCGGGNFTIIPANNLRNIHVPSHDAPNGLSSGQFQPRAVDISLQPGEGCIPRCTGEVRLALSQSPPPDVLFQQLL